VGPEHAWLKDSGRAEYHAVTDSEALQGFGRLCRLEGIIPALESSHAIAFLPRLRDKLKPGAQVVVCLSGRGDKDLQTVLDVLKEKGEGVLGL
jgi:tryptophan synthase beta subunit